MVFRSKRGQLTVFIIIGIVILFGVGLFLYLRTLVPSGPVFPGQPVKLHPVQQFVSDCIEQVGEEAVGRIGLTGGYIDFPPEVNLNPLLYLPTGHPNVKLPYWYVDGANRVPSIEYIDSQISKYVLNNLDSCLNNFEDFKNQYSITIEGKPAAITSTPASGVIIALRYPLKLTTLVEPKETFEFKDFEATVPMRLNQTYELAREMLDRENKQGFLESITMDLINLDEAVPDLGMDIGCRPSTWRISDLKPAVQQLVQTSLPYIRVQGTSFFPISDDLPYTANHFAWNYSEKRFPGIKVGFTYDQDWPMTFFASPSSNGIVKSEPLQGADILRALCIQTWNVAYDIIYPVKVDLVDDATSEHKAFVFNYAFTVSINKNRPDRTTFAIQSTTPEETALSEEFCGAATKDVTVYTLNNASGEDIEGINVSYTCGRFRCELGQSEWLGGVVTGIEKKLPSCPNGIVRGVGEDFEESFTFLSTTVSPKTVSLRLNHLKTIDDYVVFKHLQGAEGSTLSLDTDEAATISLKRPDGKEAFGSFPSGDELQPLSLLADGSFTYDTTIYLLKGEQIIGGWRGNWTVDPFALDAASRIAFHVVEQNPEPTDDTQRLLFLQNLAEASKKVPAPELG